jgi:hypothetical protein
LDTGDSKAATLDDGTRLGKFTKVRGNTNAAITDSQALMAWVEKNYPGEMMQIIRPAFEHKLLESAKRHGAAVDPSTGEIVPGIDFVTNNPYISFRSEPGAYQAVADRWHEIATWPILEEGPGGRDGR